MSAFGLLGTAALVLRHAEGPGELAPASVDPVEPPPNLPTMAPAQFGGLYAEPELEADDWMRTVWRDCYVGDADVALVDRPPPATDQGAMYRAACYAMSGRIDRARAIVDSLPDSLHAPAASVLFRTARPAADAGDYHAAGPTMELGLEYWPTHQTAMYHAGAGRLQAADTAGARIFLERFLAQGAIPEPWRVKARDLLMRMDGP